MFSEETVELVRQLLLHPKDAVYDFMLLLREFHNRDQAAEARLLRNFALSMPEDERIKYRDEIEFLKDCDSDYLAHSVFPYVLVRKGPAIESGYDGAVKLPYVIHKGRRLYFCREDKEDEARRKYEDYIVCEGLLGDGCLQKSPHAYVTKEFFVEDGDNLIDVGCAEALFTLDNIEKVDKAYMFEAEEKWRAPLRATFSPFDGKVRIVNKFVGNETRGNVVRLDDALPRDEAARYFIKMDIEGGEFDVLRESANFLAGHKVKLACCLYHRQDHEKRIVSFLRELKFDVQISDGYMLPRMGGVVYPYFRRGMAYARNY